MLEAHIVSARGSLYYAGEAHPYDLETLWEYVRDASGDLEHDVELELLVHDQGVEAPLGDWIRRLTHRGVRVHLLFARAPERSDESDGPCIAAV